ncbi:MAG: hypothetical protein WBA44_09600 [Mesorhizobium sp.]
MDDFTIANAAARRAADALIQLALDPVVIADAMIASGLAVWTAQSGRHAAALEILRKYAEARDHGA